MGKLFMAFNGPMQTTAAPSLVTTGTSIKTMMQLATPSTLEIDIIKWGICFNQSAVATPILVELIEANVAATVTAYVSQDITCINEPNDTGTLLTLGTSASGYTSSSEGSVTAVRTGDFQQIDPALSPYWYEFPLSRAFRIRASKFARIRVTAGAAVSASCFMEWGEAGD